MNNENRIAELEQKIRDLESRLEKLDRHLKFEGSTLVIHGNVEFTNKQGIRTAAIESGEGGFLSIFDEAGHPAFLIGSAHEGQFSGFQLYDRTGKIVARLQTIDGGGVILSLHGNGDESTIGLTILKDEGNYITLSNAAGDILFRQPPLENFNN